MYGAGVCVVEGHAVLVGRERLPAEWVVDLPAGLARARTGAEAAGRTAIAVARDGEARAVLEVADAVKPTSAEAAARLRAPGLTPIPLTGDHRAAADAIRPARRTLGTIKSHLFRAFAYNVAALPPAAAGLLTPMIAGAATALSSAFAAGNSPRLRTFGAVWSRGNRSGTGAGGAPRVERAYRGHLVIPAPWCGNHQARAPSRVLPHDATAGETR